MGAFPQTSAQEPLKWGGADTRAPGPGAGISKAKSKSWSSSYEEADHEFAHGRNQIPVIKGKSKARGKAKTWNRHKKSKGKGDSTKGKTDVPAAHEAPASAEQTTSGSAPPEQGEQTPATDEGLMRLCVPMIPNAGVLGVWLSAGGVAAYIDERINIAYVSSKKWTSIRASPFMVALADITAFALMISKNMAHENISNVLGVTVPVFYSGADICNSLEPLLGSVRLTNVNRFLANFTTKFIRGDGKVIHALSAPFSSSPDLGGGVPDFGDENQLIGLFALSRSMRWEIYRLTMHPAVLYFIATCYCNNVNWQDCMYMLRLIFYEEDLGARPPGFGGFRALYEPLRRGYERGLRLDQQSALHSAGLGGANNQLTLQEWFLRCSARLPWNFGLWGDPNICAYLNGVF